MEKSETNWDDVQAGIYEEPQDRYYRETYLEPEDNTAEEIAEWQSNLERFHAQNE